MISLKLRLNKSRRLNSGLYPLVIQLIYFRKKKLVYTPFKLCEENFDTRPSRTVKRALARDIMRKLSSLPLPPHSNMELARDIFLFSFFSRDMAFVDVINFKKSQIQQGVIIYQRQKMNQLLEVTLTHPLKELIRKYENSTEYVFPVIRETTPEKIYTQYRTALKLVNRQLKKISALLNVDICFTTYAARHTWATLARECGAPTNVISESLGHTSEKTTRIYLKQLEHTVIDKINEIVSQL